MTGTGPPPTDRVLKVVVAGAYSRPMAVVLDARYSYSAEGNRLLLLALVEAWGNKCYWCRTPKTFRDLQIDHIVPRNPRSGWDPHFDVDAAENLAPICGPCNTEKSNGEYQGAPRVDAIREAAVKAAPEVRRNFERFHKDSAVMKALLAVTAADLASPDVAEAITAFGMAIMPIFRESFPQLITAEYTQNYTVRPPTLPIQGREFEPPDERSLVRFDAQGQRALIVLEDVMGIPMPEAIDDVRRSIEGAIDEQIDRCFHDGMEGRYTFARRVEHTSSNPIDISVSSLRYGEDGVVFSGHFNGFFFAEVIQDRPDPEPELNLGQSLGTLRKADFNVEGGFSTTLTRKGVTDGWVVTLEPEENPWRDRTLRMKFHDE